jgi:hypothetical protein
MKQRFTYQGVWIVLTARYGEQKILTPFEKSNAASIDSKGYNIFCVTLSYSKSRFILFGRFEKHRLQKLQQESNMYEYVSTSPQLKRLESFSRSLIK